MPFKITELLERIDVSELQPWCQSDLTQEEANALLQRAHKKFVLQDDEGPLAAAGAVRATLLGPEYLWYIGWKRFTLYHLIMMKPVLLAAIAPKARTVVRDGNARGLKLARHFGFSPIGRLDGGYTVLERP